MNENYKLIEKRHVDDVNGDVYLIEHIQSGAHILKVANNDSNKTFCITFKTEPDDDSGIPHIIEHSVLNGSRKYPIKSPFDQLLKGSLYTFLNAMTGSDMTLFPVASINVKDYFNLMDVYLDAVFHPMLYTDKRILKQEGWRIVAENPDDDFHYTGVVYNEMKGVYSDPLSEVFKEVNKALYPDNGYGRSSGGYPAAIPTLTQEHFVKYHKEHYIPENSWIFLYGDADLEKELALLHGEYLSEYTATHKIPEIPLQKPFNKLKTLKGYVPGDIESSPETDSYLVLSMITCLNTDRLHYAALNVLSEVLVSLESGAVKNALFEQNLCGSVEMFHDNNQQVSLNVIGINCNEKNADKFREVIMQQFRLAAENGVNKDAVEAVLNRAEFSLSELNDAQRGMKYLNDVITAWLFGSNPIDLLEQKKLFYELKEAIANGLLEETIKMFILDNPHTVMSVFVPKANMAQESEEAVISKLAEYKASLSADEIRKIVEDSAELDRYQNTPETPEQLKCIPQLSKEDIPTNAIDYPVQERSVDGAKVVWYEGFTNGIIYTRVIFDMDTIPFELLPYGSLIVEVMGLMSTKSYSFGDLDNLVKNYTGGCCASNEIYSYRKDGRRIPFVGIKMRGKSLVKNFAKMIDIMADIINNTIFEDKDRLRDLIGRIDAEQQAELNSKGYQYARDRSISKYDPSDYLNEYISGVDYYLFMKDLNAHFDEKADDIIAKLRQVASLVFRRDNAQFFVHCEQNHYEEFEKNASRLLQSLSSEPSIHHEWDSIPAPSSEALVSNTKVQYVVRCFDFYNKDFVWNGCMNVLNKIISTDYLQTNVRVRGGAYGSWSSLCSDGLSILASYRDPNLKETLDIYDKLPEYLENFEADDETMLKYIIGTISGKDQPLATSQRGNLALKRYRQGITFEIVQRDRDEILSTTAADIRKSASTLKTLCEKGIVCVFGSEAKVNESKELFNKIIKL